MYLRLAVGRTNVRQEQFSTTFLVLITHQTLFCFCFFNQPLVAEVEKTTVFQIFWNIVCLPEIYHPSAD